VVKSQIEDFTSPRSIERLDSLLNEAYSGIMNRLTSASLDLKERELMLLRLLLAGFSAKSTAAILKDSHLNISQRKKRLLDKIGKLSPSLLDELETVLNSDF
jgi:DNA-binding NarL/FixJ family response regulator